MEYQQILLLILMFNYIGYNATVWGMFGFLPSVSDSFREWQKIGWDKYGNPFTYFCWIMTFTLLPMMPNPFFFFAAGGLGFVGTAFNLDDKATEKFHGKAAVVAILAAVGGIVFSFSAWWTAGIALALAGLIVVFNVPNKIQWIEHIAFLAVIYEFIKYFFL